MLKFLSVKYRNFLSSGDIWTEIELNKYKTTLVLGENGSGKSTLLDAICFCLFNKPFRKINKSQIINSLNDKDCLVQVEFETNGKLYKVLRGIKPNIFEVYCDGTLLSQSAKNIDYQADLEKRILKMNYKSFTQIDILGSASFTPFMQLTTGDRRIVIEDLLDIQVFSVMNVLAKQKLQQNKEDISNNKFQLNSYAEKIQIIETQMTSLKKNDDVRLEKLKDEFKELQFTYQANLTAKSVLEEELSDAIMNSAFPDDLKQKHSKLIGLKSKIENNRSRSDKDIQFYSENDSCPTCKQAIEAGFKEHIIHETENKIHVYDKGILEIEKEIDSVINSISAMDQVMSEIREIGSKIKTIDAKISYVLTSINKIKQEISNVTNTNSLYTDNETTLKSIKSDMRKLLKEQETLIDQKQYLEMSINMLKDGGIKSRIIKQYLPIINKSINSYLKSMDFLVDFNLDENFSETIKSRFRDSFSYENFSQGEKSRIDLALLFTWRHIAKLRNSVSTNLLIMDEIMDGSLDVVGQEVLMKILSLVDKDTNIFVISHTKEHLVDKFDSVLRFEKKKNYSVLTKGE